MKKLISIIIILLGFLPLMAQNDYYIKQAQSYQREAEYYSKRMNYDSVKTYQQWAKNATDKSEDYARKAKNARERAQD